MGSPAGQALKRTIDVSLAIPIVVFVLPVLCAIVKTAQLLQSNGPLFYCQQRCGRQGREFTILKFRTMNLPPEGKTDIELDPGERIYPLGKILRRSKLDEIPQFVNVLLGSMSVVGPRPHHSKDCITFAERVSEYTERFVAKPGITGLAQYSEYRGDFEWNCVESRVAKDLRYIREWSPMLDVRLIFKTINIVSRRIISGTLRRVGMSNAASLNVTPKTKLSIHDPDPNSVADKAGQDMTERRAA